MSQDRNAAVRALLATMTDWEPTPATWTGSLALRAGAIGEVGVIHDPCGNCDGTGRLAAGGRCRLCKGRGYTTVDPQTRREAPPAPDVNDFTLDQQDLARSVRRKRVRCDVCGGRPNPDRGCPGCASTGRVDVLDTALADASLRRLERDLTGGEGEHWLDLALRRKQQLWARGSYAELDHRLRLLAVEHPTVHTLVVRHLVRPDGDVVPSERVRSHVDWAVDWIAAGMPWPIVVPEHAKRWGVLVRESMWRGRTERHAQAREERNQAMRALHAAGAEVVELARMFSVTERRVRQVVSVATAPLV